MTLCRGSRGSNAVVAVPSMDCLNWSLVDSPWDPYHLTWAELGRWKGPRTALPLDEIPLLTPQD